MDEAQVTIIEELRASRPLLDASVEEWNDFNQMVCSLIVNGDEQIKGEAVKLLLEANSHLIGRYVGELNFRMYDYCEFEDAYHIMAEALAEELTDDGYDGVWDALLFRKALFRARRLLHEGYQAGGIKISYSKSRDDKVKANVVSIYDVDCESRGTIDAPDVQIAEGMMMDLVHSVFEDAEIRGVLSPFDKSVIFAHFLEGKTFREIADENGLLENSVAKRTRRIMKRLKKLTLERDPDAYEYLVA